MDMLVTLIEREGLLDDAIQEGLHRRLAGLALSESPSIGSGAVRIYLRSLTWHEGALFGMVRFDSEESAGSGTRHLFVAARHGKAHDAVGALDLAEVSKHSPWVATAELTQKNAVALHALFPWTAPTSLRERRTTIGMGDRVGVATPGHIRAVRQFDAAPVLAQQSVRENDFIGRTFDDVVANATWGVFQEGYRDGYGADGDHLKNVSSIDIALSSSMPMITLDLTEVMRPEVAQWSDAEVLSAFGELEDAFRDRVDHEYVGQTFAVGTDGDGNKVEIHFTTADARRCAVMYGPALTFSSRVNDHLDRATDGAYDLEISIDETTTPTLPAHHLFIARELQHRGVLVNSLAPRFIGDFQKAVDYIGDVAEFERQFRVHCLIARSYGNYKISVHSGSDKFAVYPIVGRETGLRLHLKTSGTSWLEALRTIAVHDPALYRRIHRFVLQYYPTALRFYHITADFDAITPPDSVDDADLPAYLDDANARQMLHISYGGILQNRELAAALYDALFRYEEEYAQLLVDHFERHIGPLGVARR